MKGRYAELDLVRAVSIIAVVMIHAASFYPWFNKSFSWSGYYVYHQVTSFAVPAFILLSGLLLTLGGDNKKFSYASFLKGRFLYIFIPYCVWSAAYFAYRWSEINPTVIANDFFTGRAYFHLYFVVIIIQLYILSPIFIWASKQVRGEYILAAFIAQIVTLKIIAASSPWLYAKLGATLFANWIFVFYVGCAIGSNYEKFKALTERYIGAIIGVLAAISVYKIGMFYYMTQYSKKAHFWTYAQVQSLENIPYTVGTVALLIFMGQRIKNQIYLSSIKTVAVNSFGIYLCHMFFLRILKTPFESYGLVSGNTLVLAVLLTSLVASIATTAILGRLPMGSMVVGKRG